MKKSIQKIIIAAAILFSVGIVNSAHAIGAIYEFNFTLTVIASSQDRPSTIAFEGVQRYAVNNHSVTADALIAARDKCRIESADDDGIAGLFGIESIENDTEITIKVVGANVDPLSCRTPNNLVFDDSQYVAFVRGANVVPNPLSGTLQRFHGIGSSRQSAISAAITACREVYSESEDCSTDDEDIAVFRGQEIVANSGGGSSNTGLIIGGVIVVGGLAYLLSDGGETGEFSFSPDFGYSATESGYSANVGGRIDFRKDKWHLYYSGGQTNRNGNFGDFQYESGGKYTANFWTATFSESVSGKTADYDLSLSAKLTGGVWNISPVYRLHSEYEKGETETRNSLNLQSEFRYNRWTIRPAAGFQWRSFGDFANNGKLQINAIHRF